MKCFLLLLSLPCFSQQWEKHPLIPPNYHAEYTQRIISYVQLPNDSSEYRKVQVFVRVLPNDNYPILPDLARNRLINIYLQKTGRKFRTLLDDGSLGREGDNLRVTDRLLNAENNDENYQ